MWKFCEKAIRNFADSSKTMRKLCLSAKFSHQEIRWNYGILHSESTRIFIIYFLKLSFEFVGKYPFFFFKNCMCISCVCYAYISEEELIQKMCLLRRRYIENEIYSSTSHKRKMIKRGTNRLLNFITIASKTPEKLSSVAASFYIFWHLYSDPNRNFKSKYQNKTFHLVIRASHKAYSHRLH